MQKKNWSAELSKYILKHLENLDKKTTKRILETLEELGKAENPLLYKDVRPLIGKLRGFYRLRVGEHRIIF
ncbi:MAG: type II toxin-antitoxin system RelE/ParE family toxin [Candidatus Aminicenantes bacterium]|nr:type II toxin-antitoxin system RelE/ParE family toxin [Candidatus Aminicenantes bacterium]